MAHSSKMKLGEQGFTLIEMAVVVMIILILAAMAVYTYVPMIGRLRLSADIRKVDQALQQAKMHAVTRGVPTGVIFYRRDGAATGNTPDEMFIFSASVTGKVLTDDDPPCRGCLLNKIYNCTLDPLCTPGAPATDTLASKEFVPIRCSASDTFPDCKSRPFSAYMNTHDNIVDGPIPLESGDYFTRILGSKYPTATSTFLAFGREFILFDQFGGVIYPDPTTAVTLDSRRIQIQNHPNIKASTNADRAAVQVTFSSGMSQVVRLGPAPQGDWLP